MRYFFDLVYLILLAVLSPWLVYKALTTGKYRRGLARKFLGLTPKRPMGRPCAWFHGVSVGEIHLLQQVVAAFRRRRPEWDCVISTTTDTGFEEARRRFPDLAVVYWPLDFSWSVKRALSRINPRLVVLAEGELWPNFLSCARERGVSVAVINGRLSPRTFRRYRYVTRWSRMLLQKIDIIAVQTEEYAANYRALGAPADRVHVTGSVKYDGATGDRSNSRTEALHRLFHIKKGELIWIAGSTQSPEEEVCLAIYRGLQSQYPNLRLFVVPRQKDRFDDAASLLQRIGVPFIRRSDLNDSSRHPVIPPSHHPVILVDTIGELSALWGLADVAFVGGSLDGRRGGQNMIEPAAYGAAVVFGPHVWNFRDTAERLLHAHAAIQVMNAAELDSAIRRLISDLAERQRLGAAGKELVRQQQGATERTIDCLDHLIDRTHKRYRAA